MGDVPVRAHVIIAKISADTRKDLANELRHMADQLDREELTSGVRGGGDAGAIYQYVVTPEQTHDKYFKDISAYLDEARKRHLL